jgi:hypothetical protein
MISAAVTGLRGLADDVVAARRRAVEAGAPVDTDAVGPRYLVDGGCPDWPVPHAASAAAPSSAPSTVRRSIDLSAPTQSPRIESPDTVGPRTTTGGEPLREVRGEAPRSVRAAPAPGACSRN